MKYQTRKDKLEDSEIAIASFVSRILSFLIDVASTLEFGLGFVQAMWNHNRMSLHDKIAETAVIKVIKFKQ